MEPEVDVIVIGGGIAGLNCARHLSEAGLSCRIFESESVVGGRVRTDDHDGFLLDRGFQVLLTAYPEARTSLDYSALDLRRFEPGALIRFQGAFHRLADPWRRPQHLLSTALSPAATLADKLKIASFRSETARCTLDQIYQRPEQRTIEMLKQKGFSDVILERYLRPFLGGIFLEKELDSSSRLCEFVFRMFSQGEAALPAAGMHQIPLQLADRLPPGTIETGVRVQGIDGHHVILANGDWRAARAIVIATQAPGARELLADPHPADGHSTICFYFAAPTTPLREPILVLNGDGQGPINNVCFPSQVSSRYAPEGQTLVSATQVASCHEAAPVEDVLRQLREWYGACVDEWRHLKTYSIDYALPVQAPPALEPVAKPAEVREGLFVCGDHYDTASLNGAMASGRRASEAARQWLSQ